MRPRSTHYTAQVKHDGRLHDVVVHNLEVPTCDACGERVFGRSVEDQISDALRAHLGLLSPREIHDQLKTLGLSQKQLASRLGIAEATVSRWRTGTVIQSRAMDNLMRVYFAVPEVRRVLAGERPIGNVG